VVPYTAHMNTESDLRAVFIDLSEAVRDYSLSKRTLWNLIAAGKLRAYQPVRKTLLKRTEIERFLDSTSIHVGRGVEK
jgi:excisionase family DNA binding protein